MKKTGSRLGKGVAAALAVMSLLVACAINCFVSHAGGRLSKGVDSGIVTAEVLSVDANVLELRILPAGTDDMTGSDVGGSAVPDGAAAHGMPDGAHAPGGADAPDATGGSAASGGAGGPGGPGGPGSPGAPDVPDGMAPKRPDDAGTPNAPGASGSSGAPGLPDGAGAPAAPSAPGADNAPVPLDDAVDGGPYDPSAFDEVERDGSEVFLTVDDLDIVTYADGAHAGEPASFSRISRGTILELGVSGGTEVHSIGIRSGHGSQGAGGSSGPGGAGGTHDVPGGGSSSSVNNGTGANVFSDQASEEGGTYTSVMADENAVRVQDGVEVSLSGATIDKSGDSTSSEDSDFHGLNAGVLVLDGSSLTVDDATVSCTGQGANGIFVYGEESTAVVSNVTINTTQGNSGGIEVAGGGSLVADGLAVDTQGTSSAAIRSDRGGGVETVTGGSFTTHGVHSPAVYCTADVTVSDAMLVSENSEGVVIEGKNSVDLQGCSLTGNVNATQTRTGISPNVMIYQSMSGDASEGTGSFSMTGGTLDGNAGTAFYVTNTDATIGLEGVDIRNAGDDLLVVAGNDGVWGRSGSNGGKVEFLATAQALRGAITVDSLSSLSLDLEDGSSYAGAINGNGQAGTVDVVLGDGCSWQLTGDSYVSSLEGDTAGIDLNGHVLYVDGAAWGE